MRRIAYVLSLILIFMIPWEGMIRLPGLGNGSKIMGFVLAVFWLATVVVTGRFRKLVPFQIAAGVFVLWNAVSVFWSMDPNKSAAHAWTWAQLLVLAVILWDLYTTRAAILAGLQAYLLGAYVAVGGAVYNFYFGNPFYTLYQRFSPGDIHPDGFGFIVTLGIPVAWYLAGSKSRKKMSHVRKIITYIYIPAALLGLALSGTRTALIAAIPGMAFGLASLARLRLSARLAMFLFVSVAVLLLLPEILPMRSFQRLGTTYTELTEGDLNNRTNNWREGIATFKEHPLIGIGSNIYRSVNTLGKVAHNSFLSVLVEVGLIGFMLFGLVLMIAIAQAWGQPKWDARFWLTILLVWAIGASTLTWEHRKATWLFLSLLVASAALTSRRVEATLRIRRIEPEVQDIPYTKTSALPTGEKGESYAV